jgi:hypothetical protein
MDRADIVNALREICSGEDFKGSESTSLARMKELEVKIGMARHEKYNSNMRGLETNTELVLLADGH